MGFKTIQPACDPEDILRIDCTLNKVMDFSNSQETPPHRLTQRIKEAEINYLLYDGPGRVLVLLQAAGFPPGFGVSHCPRALPVLSLHSTILL